MGEEALTLARAERTNNKLLSRERERARASMCYYSNEQSREPKHNDDGREINGLGERARVDLERARAEESVIIGVDFAKRVYKCALRLDFSAAAPRAVSS